ncbi:MAG: hypothetical protein IPK75_04350 [Acidobacteria bacterium]|jgi:hypothetical protein|nr:hypothetical protein [Acidobacteriota bacterium]
MTKGTLLRNNRLLGALALTVLVATLYFAQTHGGISLEVGEMALSVQPHQEGGLLVSFVSAP